MKRLANIVGNSNVPIVVVYCFFIEKNLIKLTLLKSTGNEPQHFELGFKRTVPSASYQDKHIHASNQKS